MEDAKYLGDGLYVRLDESGQVQLFAHDGERATNTVYLDSAVLSAFLYWVEAFKQDKRADEVPLRPRQ